MLAQLTFSKSIPAKSAAAHMLIILPKARTAPGDAPHATLLAATLKRRGMKADALVKSPVVANAVDGALISWVMLDLKADTFTQQVLLRRALQPLLAEHPSALDIVALGEDAVRRRAAELAVYGAWVNGALLPAHKQKDMRKPLRKINLFGIAGRKAFEPLRARAMGNLLCRELTTLPPNELTPADYRARVKKLARAQRWKYQEFDMKALRRMGAGAFVAVAQGSDPEDAAIVHLSYRHPGAKKTVALVGKGICFDTGGHNLKPSRYMHNMHEDMNGSAVALGILLAASEQKLPVNIDCWLALAQNHISPRAYKQNDVVKALNGTTVEIIHTDAEGRMVLADTLTLASRAKPDLMMDFATLTGSMAAALGARYAGIFGTREALLQRAVAIGRETGERVCAFPMDADYEDELDSKVADIKQCTLGGDADHILATRFLKRFVEHKVPWLHMDLSSSRCEGGLGIIAGEVTGFGVAWGLAMLAG